MDLLELISNTDEFLIQSIKSNLTLTYVLLFAIIFLESGVILCPYLPGDGLLFSVGVVATSTSLNVNIIIPLLITAAILGYIFNYKMGKYFGSWIIEKKISIIEKSYNKTHLFITKHGSKAILLSRFFPIVRTYIPFASGIVNMNYKIFIKQTFIGGIIWVCLFVYLGYFLGEIPWVKKNYGLIFLGLIITTLLPFFFEIIKSLVSKIKKSSI